MSATKDRNWKTWAGSRSDISRAVREAADAVARWANYPAVVTTTVRFAEDVSETLPGTDAVASLHRADLPAIRQLWVEVTPDRDAHIAEGERLRELWWGSLKQRADAGERIEEKEMGRPDEPAPLESASVLLRFPWSGNGLRIEVSGPHRDQVTGLFDRLEGILCRRQAFRRLDPDAGAALWVILLVPAIILGQWLSRVVGIAGEDDHWDAVGMVLVPLALLGAAIGFHELYPTVEIVDDDQKTRAERFAKFFWTGVGAVVASIIAAAIYDIVV